MNANPKVLVIVGTTSSGKTKLAVKLARKFNGEIISADSRQVYKGMDVGTGKDLKEYGSPRSDDRVGAGKVKYHLIDVASPKKQFTLADWQTQSDKAIKDILKRGKLPIVTGGTGLYISALTLGYELPKQDGKLKSIRSKLDKLSLNQLLTQLKKVDPKTYKIIDQKNRRRVQRALEIYYQTGKPKSVQAKKKKPDYDFLILGISVPKEKLKKNILKRLKDMLNKEGMVDEVKKLHRNGVTWKRLEEFGLGYGYAAKYLQGKLKYEEMVDQLGKAIINLAKRQTTWFRRNKDICWIKMPEAEKLVKKFVNKKI